METEKKETGQWAVRARAFIVALLIIPLDQYWVLMMEKVRTGPYPTTISIFANAIFILTLLVGVNRLLRRFSPRAALTSSELVLIYSMVAVAAALAGHDMMPTLVGQMTYAWQFATVENRWAETFIPYLPTWASVTDPYAIRGLWEGNASLYEPRVLEAWLKPVLWWVSFATVLMFCMMCISTIVRKSWSEHERLPFPIIQLPHYMSDPEAAIWKNRLFWLGAAIPCAIVIVNSLAVYFPSIPTITVSDEGRNITEGLTSKPWNALGWTPYTLYPFVIGIGFLLRTDLLFSCVFFYWFFKFQNVLTAMMGLEGINQFPYVRQQVFGAYLSIAFLVMWTSRGYLKQVWLKALGRDSRVDDRDEAVSYRFAILGLVAGFLYLCAFMMKIGMTPWMAVLAFLIYFAVSTSIARIRAELGPPVHDGHTSGPDGHMVTALGANKFSNGDFVGLSYFYWFNRAYRAHPMPIGLESLKLAQMTHARQSSFFWGIVGAVAFGALATFWAYLHIGYQEGFSVGVSQGGVYASGAVRNVDFWFQRSPDIAGPNWGANFGIVGGILFTVFLYSMHLRVVGWPFHPIGYAVTSGWAINIVWFPLLLAYIIKTVVLRYGGLQLYRKLLPFFLGLIIGEMVPGCIVSLVGISLNIPYYNFWGH